MGPFPKRRKSKNNPYTLGFDTIKNSYTLTFKDTSNTIQVVEINELLYKEFNQFELDDLSEMNEYDNHIEHSELYDETLYKRTVNKTMSIEEIIEYKLLKEQLNEFIKELPIIQRNRLLKYYMENKTYEEIAKEEKCTKRAIKFSVDIAIKKITEKMKK